MKAFSFTKPLHLGWKYNSQKDKARAQKRSAADLVSSMIVAFLIILLVTQILAHFDRSLKVGMVQESLTKEMAP